MLSFLLFKSIAKGNSFLKVFKKELPPQIYAVTTHMAEFD